MAGRRGKVRQTAGETRPHTAVATIWLAVTLALTLCAAGAAAQDAPAEVQMGRYTSAQTPYGTLQVTGAPQDQELYLDGQPLGLGPEYSITIGGVFRIADDPAHWVVTQSAHGGNMCPDSLVILRLGPPGPARTDAFGECLGPVMAVRVLPGRFEIDLGDPDLAVDVRTFAFDGTTLTDTPVPAVTGGPATGPVGDARRWIGQHPGAMLEDAGERARLAAIMALDDMEDLRAHTGVANVAVERGGWVTGSGCMPHACNVAKGGWGIRIADGAVAAFVLDDGQADHLFGLTTDPVIAALIAEVRAQ